MLGLNNVTAGYGATTVLRGVSLVAPAFSVVALLGPNGAGKTTLLRAMSGLLKISSGELVLDGIVVNGLAPHAMATRGVCHVPEGRGVFASLSVRDNILVQAKPGQEREALERATSAFPKLGDRLSQISGTMSGGEQQMLALARAYVQRPRVVLLDEVSMGLAPRVVDEIFDFLKRLAEEGTTLVLVEQYVARALEVADYVYLLSRGEVTFAGESSELSSSDLLEQYVGVEGSVSA